MNMIGTWGISPDAKNWPAGNLPQEVASAFTTVFLEWTGAGYVPLMLLATQLVNGINYMILCRETTVTNPPVEKISKVILNISHDGTPSIVSIEPLF